MTGALKFEQWTRQRAGMIEIPGPIQGEHGGELLTGEGKLPADIDFLYHQKTARKQSRARKTRNFANVRGRTGGDPGI